MSRVIGIRHQEKATAGGEIRPTQLFITDDSPKPVQLMGVLDLSDISEELGWIVGKYPAGWREVSDPSEDLTPHIGFIKFGPIKAGETADNRHGSQVKKEKGKVKLARKVPSGYDGVRPDDVYVAMMGGSGHQLMASISARLAKLGGSGKAYHIPPIRIADQFGKDRNKDRDANLVLHFFASNPNLFYEVRVQDQKIAKVKSAWNLREAAQDARKAHGNRLRKVAIMAAYANPDLYVGAGLETQTLNLIAGDENMEELESDESSATLALKKVVEDTDVWQMIFSQVEGIGPAIAGGIIAAIGDVRRFHTPWQMAKYCGVGVEKRPDGSCTIQRRRSGQNSGWQNDARGCLWNFADQCNRRQDSVWGQHLLMLKARLQAKHPVPVQVEVKDSKTGKMKKVMRYTKGHIHKIAIWKLQTDFVCWLWREWGRMMRYGEPKDFRPSGNRSTDIITPDVDPGITVGSAPAADVTPTDTSARASAGTPEAEAVVV